MHKRILFVDDEQRVLEALTRMLRSQRSVWEMICESDPCKAWRRLQEESVDAVVCDVNMPGMNGLELLERIRRSEQLAGLPVVILTGLESRALKRQALDRGASDLLNNPVDPEDLIARLRSILRMKAYQDALREQNAELERRVQERTRELQRSRMDVIWRLGKAAEHRDNETGNHVIRVGVASRILAETLGMERDYLETLFVAAPLHDIGKIAIPDAVLTKRGRLTHAEWDVMKQHCWLGARILREDTRAAAVFGQWRGAADFADCPVADNPILRMAASIALLHHEKWNGGGYPQGLAGEQIPLEARIVAVADVFDALTSQRPYKAPYSVEEAIQMIDERAGSHFDPAVHRAFRQALPALRRVHEQFSDQADRPPSLAQEDDAADRSLIPEEADDAADLVCR